MRRPLHQLLIRPLWHILGNYLLTTISTTRPHPLTHLFINDYSIKYRNFLNAVSKVTANDLKRVSKDYFSSLFDPKSVSCAVCCNTSKVDEIRRGLEG